MKYIDLTYTEQREVAQRVQAETGLTQQIIGKDWWVTAVLRALFALPYANYLSFKGGTSLSKCWNLISRFSEDADIAIDREYLGFGGILSKTQISDKLRRASCSFVREKMQVDLRERLMADGINKDKFTVKVDITPITTTDPEIIES
jgi:predicted nucleotidyltransferase component of viral defense system